MLVAADIGSLIYLLIFFISSGIWLWILLGMLGAYLKASSPLLILLAQELMLGNTGVAGGLIMGTAIGLGQVRALATGILGDSYGLKFADLTASVLLVIGLILSLLLQKKIRLMNLRVRFQKSLRR